jgi:hypothetical protein
MDCAPLPCLVYSHDCSYSPRLFSPLQCICNAYTRAPPAPTPAPTPSPINRATTGAPHGPGIPVTARPTVAPTYAHTPSPINRATTGAPHGPGIPVTARPTVAPTYAHTPSPINRATTPAPDGPGIPVTPPPTEDPDNRCQIWNPDSSLWNGQDHPYQAVVAHGIDTCFAGDDCGQGSCCSIGFCFCKLLSTVQNQQAHCLPGFRP